MNSIGFILAGLTNILGVLIFSLGFTNDYLSDLYPQVFSKFGLVVIMIWGLAYLAVGKTHESVRPLVGVFAIEKAVYVISWVMWMVHHVGELPGIFEKSLLTGVFYSVYGILDLGFGLFFAWVALKAGP